MPSPFPGMDPYLEGSQVWPDVHLSLMTGMRDALALQVAPAYYVRIEQRTYIARVNERDIREGYLEIHDAHTHEVVTAVEVVSPTNKAPGHGRREYQAKREQVLQSLTNLVEIDLLRGGEPMEMEPLPESDYRILIARGWEYPCARVHAFGIRDQIAELCVPLRHGEPEPRLNLGELLAGIYDRARYDISLDYRFPPPDPALSSEDGAWLNALLHAPGLRG